MAATPKPTLDARELPKFLARCAKQDWRKDPANLPGSSVLETLKTWLVAEMRQCGAIVSMDILLDVIRGASPEFEDASGINWLVDHLMVVQIGAALQDLVDGRCKQFDCASVPEGIFWRKNASRDWSHQCLPDRYGWVSDSESIRDLFSVLLKDGSSERFCDTMGFTKCEDPSNNFGYGPMFFMIYTRSQLEQMQRTYDVKFFRPVWAEVSRQLKDLFERRVAEGALEKHLPAMWTADVPAWRDALTLFERVVGEVATDETRMQFLHFSIHACKPMWDQDFAPKSFDPRWHPVCAARHLLDQWFGANHLFMGDGYTWSESQVRGHSEWLLSSFANFDVQRVSIFREAP